MKKENKKSSMKNASTAGTGGQDLPLNRTELTTAQLGATASRESVVRSPESVGQDRNQPTVNWAVEAPLLTPNCQLPARPMQLKSAASGEFRPAMEWLFTGDDILKDAAATTLS